MRTWRVRGLVGWLIGMAAAGLALCAVAGEYRTVEFGADGAAVTNDQANAQWELSGVLIRFGRCPTGTVEIARQSGGVRYLLSAAPAGATSVWWWAWQPIPYRYGDVVTVGSGGGTGTVQVLQQTGR